MNLLEFVSQNFIILIPTLYVLGAILKQSTLIKDKHIPLSLIVLGVLGAVALGGLSIESIIQGILATGVTVLGDQTIKQLRKDE